MKDKIIAKVYAKTFTELAKDNNVDIAKELTSLQEVINASNDLENVLFLEVFTEEEKSENTPLKSRSPSTKSTLIFIYLI